MASRRFVAGVSSAAAVAVLLLAVGATRSSPESPSIQFVFTSDAHYGLTRPSFRGATNVGAETVNQALVTAIDALPRTRFPQDGGLRAGAAVGTLDFIVEGGDVANRAEQTETASIQPAALSWQQFIRDYVGGITTRTPGGDKTPLFVVPGNHDASNAVGFTRAMEPASDTAAMTSIYNLMLQPPHQLEPTSFNYDRDRLFFTRDLRGIHFQFLQIWPDSAMRRRMADDLSSVGRDTPVVVFTHDQPDAEGKHFINPNGAHDINATDGFENLLADVFADGSSPDLPSTREQQELETFLDQHPNLTAYFHGNSNWHQSYEWNGPGRSARLHVFRADSPMKGAVSSADESRLSFEVATIDPAARTMTVRECLWNATRSAGGLAWGDSITIALESAMATGRENSEKGTTTEFTEKGNGGH